MPFVEKVNQKAAGRLKISWVGPEAVPPFEQLKPLREGLFDALYTHAAYHLGEVALGVGMSLFSASGKERRAAGLNKIVDEAYRKKANVTYLSAMAGGGYQLLLKRKIDRADLTHFKIRTSPFYDPMVKALGGAPVRTTEGEMYSALEKGVVDGATWTALGCLEYKMYEVVKYMVRPYYGEGLGQIMVNLDSWNRLSKDLQDLLTNVAIEVEEESRVTILGLIEKEDKELQKLGMELCVLHPGKLKSIARRFMSVLGKR